MGGLVLGLGFGVGGCFVNILCGYMDEITGCEGNGAEIYLYYACMCFLTAKEIQFETPL